MPSSSSAIPSGPHFLPFLAVFFCGLTRFLASSPEDWLAADRAAAAAAFFARLDVRGPGEPDPMFKGVAGLDVSGVGIGVTSVEVVLLVGAGR